MREVTLTEILTAREARAARQQAWLAETGKPLICFTMNIAGPIKVDPWTRWAFRAGCDRLLAALHSMGDAVLKQADFTGIAGHELMLAVDADALALKRLCVKLEDADALGRLYDMDVLGADGLKLDRAVVGGTERVCLVCGKAGRGCASRRIHSVEEIQQATRRIIEEAATRQESQRIASLAVQSLLDEVCATPKPGLVDCHDSGSHRDMDRFTFAASAAALPFYFAACFADGYHLRGADAQTAFSALQVHGLEAERRMYAATEGVNTHKGAVYTLGLLCGAAGRVWSPEGFTQADWLRAVADLAQVNTGPGVRAELAAGLPSVRGIALPALQSARERGFSFNDRCLYTLLSLIAEVDDTNMVARGGKAAAQQARAQAAQALQAVQHGAEIQREMAALNQSFVEKHLSPGGCADLLAAALLVERWMAG